MSFLSACVCITVSGFYSLPYPYTVVSPSVTASCVSPLLHTKFFLKAVFPVVTLRREDKQWSAQFIAWTILLLFDYCDEAND